MKPELIDCAVNPVVYFLRGRIQFYGGEISFVDINPLKNQQVQIKNNQQAEVIPGLNVWADPLQNLPGLFPVIIGQEIVFFHQVSKAGGYCRASGNLIQR